MPSRENSFVSRWRVPGTVDLVSAILLDAPGLAGWWPSLFRSIAPVREAGIDDIYEATAKGWMPYTVRRRFRVASFPPSSTLRFEFVDNSADCSECRLQQDGAAVVVSIETHVAPGSLASKLASLLFWPLYVANFRWIMARGEESLSREIRRRLASNDAERDAVPPPPPPMSVRASWAMIVTVGLSVVVPGSLLLKWMGNRGGEERS
ncbi:MAG: hypothetical protein P4L33_18290 [Capsulimonadaceae bacterium]|nr:hypothetical protein [Capsulimonadaceae bacterium]